MTFRWMGIACLLALALAAKADINDFRMVTPETAVPGNPALTETLWQTRVAPGGEYDRIGLHRYQRRDAPASAVMLYLPGTNMNGELGVTDQDHNLWLYLAARGVKVYTLDYRTHFVPNEPVPDLSFMKDWTMARFVDDARVALAKVRKLEGDKPVFIAGFSRGVGYAYILAGEENVTGLVALDGSLKSYHEPGFDRAAAMQKLKASGQWGTVLSRSRGWSSRTEMMRRAASDPKGPAMGKFASIGAQVETMLYYSWGPGVLANPHDGISSVQVLAAGMENYDRCFPAIQNVEGMSIALQADDPATPLDDHFGKMVTPVLYFGSTNMGADSLMSGIYSASKNGARDVTLNVLERYGHVDVLFGDKARQDVYDIVLGWIRQRVVDGGA